MAGDDSNLANSSALNELFLEYLAHADIDPELYSSRWAALVEQVVRKSTEEVSRERLAWANDLYSDRKMAFAPAPVSADLLPVASAAAGRSGRAFLRNGAPLAAHDRFATAWNVYPSPATAIGNAFEDRIYFDWQAQFSGDVVFRSPFPSD